MALSATARLLSRYLAADELSDPADGDDLVWHVFDDVAESDPVHHVPPGQRHETADAGTLESHRVAGVTAYGAS